MAASAVDRGKRRIPSEDGGHSEATVTTKATVSAVRVGAGAARYAFLTLKAF